MKMLLPIAISVVLISYGWSQDEAVNNTEQSSVSSTYEKISIEEILDKQADPEMVKLSGEIIKKLKCTTYLFRDKTGEIKVHIGDDNIPEKGLLFNTPIIIKGEIEPASDRTPARVDVEKIRYFF